MWYGLLWSAAVADLAATTLAIQKWGISGESNPVAVFIYGIAGLLGLAIAKVLATYVVYSYAKRSYVGKIAGGFAIAFWTFGAATAVLVLV